jgi:hypothetical protein
MIIVFEGFTKKPWFDTNIYFFIHRLVLRFYLAYEGNFSMSLIPYGYPVEES